MSTEIVLPKNNELEFLEIASKLGIKKIYFLYDFDEYDQVNTQKKLDSIKNYRNIYIETGFLVNQKNMYKAFRQSKLLVTKSSEKDRQLIEGKKIRLIYGFEETSRKDYLHQRASGLNHIICEIAKKNNISIGFSYSSLLNKDGISTSLLIGRMVQNINLCQKYKVKTVIGSFSEKPCELRAHHDVISLFTMFGMEGKRIKESLKFDYGY